jgi:hypothetical protein
VFIYSCTILSFIHTSEDVAWHNLSNFSVDKAMDAALYTLISIQEAYDPPHTAPHTYSHTSHHTSTFAASLYATTLCMCDMYTLLQQSTAQLCVRVLVGVGACSDEELDSVWATYTALQGELLGGNEVSVV